MKTGIVLEINNKSAIVMKSDGTFAKVPMKESWQRGDIVEFDTNNINVKMFFSIAACIVLVIFISGYNFLKPISYLDININPSLEITLNKYSKIIKIQALNDDGKYIVSDINIWGKNVDDGIKILYDKMNQQGFLKDSRTLDILVICKNEAISNNIQSVLSNTTNHHLNSIGVHCNVNIHQPSSDNIGGCQHNHSHGNCHH